MRTEEQHSPSLYWLQHPPTDWRARLADLSKSTPGEAAWAEAIALANYRLNFQLTNALATTVARLFRDTPDQILQTRPERLAILSSSTTTHLHASLRVGALRRGIWLDVYETEYDQYRQELLDITSPLHAFAPSAILFAFDARHVSRGVQDCRTRSQAIRALDELCETTQSLWRLAQARFDCPVIQQTVVPSLPPQLGNNEHRHPASPAAFIARFNDRLRDLSESAGIDLLALDARIAHDGLMAWQNPSLWLHAKQEIALPAAPMYGDLVGRLLAARQGRSAKCCVLDLDNTLWGGVIGDDQMDGIIVGQGSALGEAFAGVQSYALALRQRGILLAVCSKNDERVARQPFDAHPDMILKHDHFACFVANWDDKATNIRTIARQLNIGLDALVFVDDNPFERELVRRELPMVAVPELPEDPALVPQCLADAGYFETATLTDEDFQRAAFYRSDAGHSHDSASATDLKGYLAGLAMDLRWARVDQTSLGRTVQLINKTNQFNLTTRRYTEAQVRGFMSQPNILSLQLRLVDRFGDNGIIAVVIGRLDEQSTVEIDTWLMSCRVLGRQVEEATLNIVVEAARRIGAKRLVGIYRPSQKNGMVSRHYERLGFTPQGERSDGVASVLDLASFVPRETFIQLSEVSA